MTVASRRALLQSSVSVSAILRIQAEAQTPRVRKPVYKNISKKFAEAFISGEQIKIATYDHYRRGEGDRVDQLEGRAINYVAEQTVSFPRYDADAGGQRAALAALGFAVGPNDSWNGNVFRNVTASSELEAQYIFCSSNNPDFEHALKHDERIFLISDIALFGQMLAAAAPSILGRTRHGPVVYEEREKTPF